MKPLLNKATRHTEKGKREEKVSNTINLTFVTESERESLRVKSYGYLLP